MLRVEFVPSRMTYLTQAIGCMPRNRESSSQQWSSSSTLIYQLCLTCVSGLRNRTTQSRGRNRASAPRRKLWPYITYTNTPESSKRGGGQTTLPSVSQYLLRRTRLPLSKNARSSDGLLRGWFSCAMALLKYKTSHLFPSIPFWTLE